MPELKVVGSTQLCGHPKKNSNHVYLGMSDKVRRVRTLAEIPKAEDTLSTRIQEFK